jgi:hypothetical protein
MIIGAGGPLLAAWFGPIISDQLIEVSAAAPGRVRTLGGRQRVTPNKRMEPTLDPVLPSLPLRSVRLERGSPLVFGVTQRLGGE